MNLSPRWVAALTGTGFDACHWSTLGPPDAPDSAIMTCAREYGFVVLTHDLDFSSKLAATGGLQPSVVQIRTVKLDPDVIGQSVTTAPIEMRSELENGASLSIDAKGARLRVLSLRSNSL